MTDSESGSIISPDIYLDAQLVTEKVGRAVRKYLAEIHVTEGLLTPEERTRIERDEQLWQEYPTGEMS